MIEIKLQTMSKFKDNFSSESFYPDSNFYAEQEKDPIETPVSEDQISNMGEIFEWPIILYE